ncbi:glycosyltransferase [Acidiferrobacter sp.]|uniref:glycosyltransferase n=1 Tax=Acidiferrobacter sp. TaxID=1872107 RepID=UPI002616F028|nr:glycosyltransferase [Acidiferrobacter sp.]
MVWTDLAAAAAGAWLALLLLPWQPWRTRERLEADPGVLAQDAGSTDVTVLMPARNEAAVIGRSLAGLRSQGMPLRVIVIDDGSTDDTGAVAARAGLADLTILQAPPLPSGWTGKLWALEQGRQAVTTPYVLLLDADIALEPGLVATLREKARREHRALVSLMAAPAMSGFWDRWWMPAFIYFFKLLYPFRLANHPQSATAAAAGGCLLVTREALTAIGGFGALRGAVIDDCTLASLVKRQGLGAIWIGLTRSAVMLRATGLRGFWRMVARTAFTQLRYSYTLLTLCAVVMVIVFVVPWVALGAGGAMGRALGLTAWILMGLSYAPTARFYRQSPFAVAALPLAGVAFLLMTFTSAVWYARGLRSRWKGRDYRRGPV